MDDGATGADTAGRHIDDVGTLVLDASAVSLGQLAELGDTVLAGTLRRLRAAVDRDTAPVAGFNSAI
ncbi:FxSxx-COOH cyclophane-containing RiPP peptide [Dactylosporangium sp. NPDC049525]|uniref:FxSxx-COOH cyclophane-containing RiPP peptide n=1 Tax=Dactylosporangium sp. NPDC049525 TaxID=3154730 RepID=UPI00342B46D0